MTVGNVGSNTENCPLCGSDNKCAQVQSKNERNGKIGEFSCWCLDINLTQDAKTSLKQNTPKDICLCKACIYKLALKVD